MNEKVNLNSHVETKQYDPAHIRNLFCAVLFTAVEDYCGESSDTDRNGLPDYIFDKSVIRADLRKPRLVSLTDGMSITVLNALKSNPSKVKENLKKVMYNVVER